MKLQVKTFPVGGPLLLTPNKFEDARGFFSETYSVPAFEEVGIVAPFVQDNHLLSIDVGTIRGLHFQAPPCANAKLVRVVRGSIFDVALDIRKGSPSYGRHVAVELSAESWQQFYIPSGFAHALCTLEPNTEVIYKVTSVYAPKTEGGIYWKDPALGIPWPSQAGNSVSKKDLELPMFDRLESPFVY